MHKYLLMAAPIVAAMASPAFADTYTKANFSGGIFGGNANVSSPFSGNGFTQGQTFGGSFVYDNDQIPANNSGFVNVFPAGFPDAANIPAADQFTFNFGPLTLTAANADLYGIQYNNGAFNGFALFQNFAFQSATYQLQIQGGSLSVYLLDSNGWATGNSLVNGYINLGDAAVTGGAAYTPVTTTPTPSVPEPATWAMLIIGFGAVGGTLRRQRVRARVAFA